MYDVDAKVDAADAPKLENLTFSQRKAMFLPLLEERFNLKYHYETRELPLYVLTIAKGGSKLKESAIADAPTKGGPPHRLMMMRGDGSIEAKANTIENLMQALSPEVGRTIIYKTGLTGNYDYTLNWASDQGGGPSSLLQIESAKRGRHVGRSEKRPERQNQMVGANVLPNILIWLDE